MSRLDIGSIRQVPLHADNDVLEVWEVDRGQDIVRDTLLKHDRRVGGEFGVSSKCRGEGGSIVAPLGVRNDILRPSQSERGER